MPAVNSCRYGLPTFLMMESARKSRGTLQLLAATLMRPRISPAMAGACDILLSSAIIVRVLITCLAGNAPRLSTSPAYARRRAIRLHHPTHTTRGRETNIGSSIHHFIKTGGPAFYSLHA